MNVPNHEKKAFRDMTAEERSVIVEAFLREDAEVMDQNKESWIAAKIWFLICPENVYRTRPRQLSIPWEHIKPEYKWAAMDMDGRVYVFKDRPVRDKYDHYSDGFADISVLSIDKSSIDWRESLTARPEGA